MLQPTDMPPASRAPRLAPSITPGPPPVITVKPIFTMARTDLAAPARSTVALLEARRAEHRHARADEMQRPEAADEVAAGPRQHQQLAGSRLRTFEEEEVVVTGGAGVGAGPGSWPGGFFCGSKVSLRERSGVLALTASLRGHWCRVYSHVLARVFNRVPGVSLMSLASPAFGQPASSISRRRSRRGRPGGRRRADYGALG